MKVEQLAEKHYQYLESVMHKMFVDAFIHGFKHGKQEKK